MEALSKRMSCIKHFQLPRLSSNIPIVCHPDRESISQEVAEWIIDRMQKERESVDRMKVLEMKLGDLASMLHPRGIKERVILSGKHLWSILVLDDVLETRSKDKLAKLKLVILEIATGSSKQGLDLRCLDFFQEVMDEVRKEMPPSLLSRYLTCLKNYLDAVEDEVEHTLIDCSVPPPDVYRLLRRGTGFVEGTLCVFTEFAIGIQAQHHHLQSSDFRQLVDCIADHVLMVNDLLSFRKEYYDKPQSFSHNWISVLFHHSPHNTNFQDVINLLCDMIHEEDVKILELKKCLLDKAEDTGLQNLANELPLIASGHFQWAYSTGRYHGYNNDLLTGEIFHGTLLLHPEATIIISLEDTE